MGWNLANQNFNTIRIFFTAFEVFLFESKCLLEFDNSRTYSFYEKLCEYFYIRPDWFGANFAQVHFLWKRWWGCSLPYLAQCGPQRASVYLLLCLGYLLMSTEYGCLHPATRHCSWECRFVSMITWPIRPTLSIYSDTGNWLANNVLCRFSRSLSKLHRPKHWSGTELLFFRIGEPSSYLQSNSML